MDPISPTGAVSSIRAALQVLAAESSAPAHVLKSPEGNSVTSVSMSNPETMETGRAGSGILVSLKKCIVCLVEAD